MKEPEHTGKAGSTKRTLNKGSALKAREYYATPSISTMPVIIFNLRGNTNGKQSLYVLNLEEGLPNIAQARYRLLNGLFWANRHVGIKVIHGYSTMGRGSHTLRHAARELLCSLKDQGRLNEVIFGEDWNIFNAACLRTLETYPFLRKDKDLCQPNLGITIALFPPEA
jgi:hypothetical protein